MPEGNDDAFTLPIELIDVVITTRLDPHRPAQCANDCSSDWRQNRRFQPTLDRFQERLTHLAHPEIASRAAVYTGLLEAVAHHGFPLQRSYPCSTRRFDQHAESSTVDAQRRVSCDVPSNCPTPVGPLVRIRYPTQRWLRR